MRKKKQKEVELNQEILVGFVNSFNFNDEAAEEALGGHPFVGRLYQIVKDDQYGYRLHIGAENNPGNMSGILLGHDLKGDHESKWTFDIAIVTKDNFLNFDIHQDDTVKLGEWFETDNKDLRDIITQPVKVVTNDNNGDFIEMAHPSDFNIEDQMAELMAKVDMERERLYGKFSDDLNKIMEKDKEFFDVLVEMIAYLASTYNDKYEAAGTANISRDFMNYSKSPDTAIFNTLKYLQRYCTTGFEKSQNIKDLYKAVHYVMFELQRKKRNG